MSDKKSGKNKNIKKMTPFGRKVRKKGDTKFKELSVLWVKAKGFAHVQL